ncbi:hypothetical protein DPMN_062143 [Dreissena polymorpha]|uniref:Uncharacterized protein n=1 Tax=Dreissena polymorpha TaxID=45954 RepID=A0A9D4HHU8_DREPO|nr:hypothetical protein DPMN_062143 [Dreissena polymorpha]
MLFYSSHFGQGIFPQQNPQIQIADRTDDFGYGAVCDQKAIHQTVPDARYRNFFANLMPAVRCVQLFHFFG